MAEVIRYVDPDASGSGTGVDWTNAYTSLNAWEVGEQTSLVTDGDWHHVYDRASSGTAGNTATSISGWTTGADNYILIEAASTDRADANGWDTGKYRLEVTDNNAIVILEDYVRIDGLQVRIIYSASSGKACLYAAGQTSGANDIRMSNCRLRGDTNAASNSTGIQIASVNAVVKIWNCIMYDFDHRGFWADDSSAVDIYNCTIYNIAFRGIDQDSGTINVYNTAVLDTADDFSGTFNLISYCASDDNDGTNNVAESGGGAGWPDDFEGAATGDFRLKSTSNLVGSGTDNPGSGLYSDDIEGTARSSTWDVGAYEYASSGYTITADSGSYTLTGTEAGTLKGSKVAADSGTYALTGQDAGTYKGFHLDADTGGYTLTGISVDLLKGFHIDIEAGSYLLTGQDVDLLYSGGGYILTADPGVYNLTGQDTGLIKDSKIAADSGTYVLTGQDVGTLKGFHIDIESGTFTLTGSDVGFLRGYVIEIEPGVYVLTGSSADLDYSAAVGEIIALAGNLDKILSLSGTLDKAIALKGNLDKIINVSGDLRS